MSISIWWQRETLVSDLGSLSLGWAIPGLLLALMGWGSHLSLIFLPVLTQHWPCLLLAGALLATSARGA